MVQQQGLVERENNFKAFTDGFGLCSSTQWWPSAPAARDILRMVRSVHLNQKIQQLNLPAVPGPVECMHGAASIRAEGASVCHHWDVAAAHRLVRIRRQDWGLLACRAESESSTLFINGGDVRHIVRIPVVEPPVWDGRAMLNHFLLSVGLRG